MSVNDNWDFSECRECGRLAELYDFDSPVNGRPISVCSRECEREWLQGLADYLCDHDERF